jgi:hypothetical protein
MTQEFITLDQLKAITEKLKSELGQRLKPLYPNQFQQQIIAKLQEATLHHQFLHTKTDAVEEHNEKSRAFHHFQQKELKPLALQRIAELLAEIDTEVLSDNFAPYLETMHVLLNHGHNTVRDLAMQLTKSKYCLGAIDYFVADILSGNEASIKTIFELNINAQDWEQHLKNQQDWLPLTKALKKVATTDIDLPEEDTWKNNSLYFMNVVWSFSCFIPTEMAQLENEIIHYLDIERYGHRSFECDLYPLQHFYTSLKPYLSVAGKEKIKNIIHTVAQKEYAPDDFWVSQNVLPALIAVGENDENCQKTIAMLLAQENGTDTEEDDDKNDDTNYEELIDFCENYITNNSPENDKEEYYKGILNLIKVHLQYTDATLYDAQEDQYEFVFGLLTKATEYTAMYYEANYKLEDVEINSFFDLLFLFRLKISDDNKWGARVEALHQRFTAI